LENTYIYQKEAAWAQITKTILALKSAFKAHA